MHVFVMKEDWLLMSFAFNQSCKEDSWGNQNKAKREDNTKYYKRNRNVLKEQQRR